MLAKREIKRQRRKYGIRIITQEMQGVKKNQFVCHALQCEEDGLATRDRHKWKNWKDIRGEKYQDDEMEKKAKREIDEWEESRQEYDGESQRPRMTMPVLMQITAFLKWENGWG